MSSLFKLHPVYLKQIRAAVRTYGSVWFHGDGNMYTTDEMSDTASTYYNPGQKEIGYRIKFTSVDQVPTNLEDLEKALIAANQKELATSREDKQKVGKDLGLQLTDEDDFETENLKELSGVGPEEGYDEFGNPLTEKKGPGRPKKS